VQGAEHPPSGPR